MTSKPKVHMLSLPNSSPVAKTEEPKPGMSKHNKGGDTTPTFTTYEKHTHCEVVKIGGYDVWLGGRFHITKKVLKAMDIICPLNGELPETAFGQSISVVNCRLQDYGGVPKEWKDFITNLAAQITAGKRVLGYCTGGHGRTGTFAASLLSLMEPDVEDPIKELRSRYCKRAVETLSQADAVFGMRGSLAFKEYEDEFSHKAESFSGSFGWSSPNKKGGGVTQADLDAMELEDAQRLQEWLSFKEPKVKTQQSIIDPDSYEDFLKNKLQYEMYSEYLIRKKNQASPALFTKTNKSSTLDDPEYADFVKNGKRGEKWVQYRLRKEEEAKQQTTALTVVPKLDEFVRGPAYQEFCKRHKIMLGVSPFPVSGNKQCADDDYVYIQGYGYACLSEIESAFLDQQKSKDDEAETQAASGS